jgi:outer membrane protein OmpA-like peptidoglycan-associated protein
MNAQPGFYVGAEGGLNWLLNTTIAGSPTTTSTGWAVGGVAGYDFVGPRVELEGRYRQTPVGNLPFVSGTASYTTGQLSFLANALYDFIPNSAITPYVGAGLGIAYVDSNAPSGNNGYGGQLGSTVFAYQAIIGIGWRIDDNFRLNLDARYFGTTNPSINDVFGNSSTWTNNNFSVMAGLQYKFGAASASPPPPPEATVAPPSFMVFFDWDRSNVSPQALAAIQQAADAFKAKGSARITATGHTDTSGPEAYNMALSLRRANAVKDALVRDGVPAQDITVIGMGEKGLLIPTGDGVREPQNRRVEIVVQ